DVGVHHPDVGAFEVADLAGGVEQQAAEDGTLLRHQQRGEGDAEDDAEVLDPVAGQHFQRDPVHRLTPFRFPRAARLNSVMWSASVSTSSRRTPSSPSSSVTTGLATR